GKFGGAVRTTYTGRAKDCADTTDGEAPTCNAASATSATRRRCIMRVDRTRLRRTVPRASSNRILRLDGWNHDPGGTTRARRAVHDQRHSIPPGMQRDRKPRRLRNRHLSSLESLHRGVVVVEPAVQR